MIIPYIFYKFFTDAVFLAHFRYEIN